MTKTEATTTYCDLTPSGFSTRIKARRLPGPIAGIRRWDRQAIGGA